MASFDSSVEQEKKKHSRRRTSVAKGNPEVTYKPVYHRRRFPRVRHALKMHSECKDPSDPVTDDGNDREGDISLRGKRREHERSRKLSEDNYVEEKAFDVADADSGITSSRIRNKHFSEDTLRIAKEYQRLQKSYKSVREECDKLSSSMERREAEYQRVCSHYETLVQMVQEMDETKVELIKRNQKLEMEKEQSNEDIMLLKNIVYQLNAELERCQDKLRDRKSGSGSTNFVENSGKEKVYSQRVWGSVSFHALAPLLNAYQENLSEKRELVIMYEQEMADFGSRCKAILTENELMHKEVEELRFECNRCAKEIKSVVENTTSLKKQNDSLQKESAVLRRDASEIRSTYELKMEAILSRNEVLKREHMTATSELSNLKGKYEVLSKEFEKMKSKGEQTVPTIVHTTAIDECRTLLDELKYRYESEKRNLSNQIKRMEENQPENEKELIMVTAERNHLNTLIGSLERNLKRTQRKAERTQTVLYSTRVSRDSLKEQLKKATAYCEDLFSEYEKIIAERQKLLALLRETEKENATIDRLGKTITSRVDGLKNQLESVRRGAKQQVESVEKRIKLQELRVRRMKREYRRKIRHFKDVIKQREDRIDKLQKEKHADLNNSAGDLPRTMDAEGPVILRSSSKLPARY